MIYFMSLQFSQWHKNVRTRCSIKVISWRYRMGFTVPCAREAHKEEHVVWDLMKWHLGPKKNKSKYYTSQMSDGPLPHGK